MSVQFLTSLSEDQKVEWSLEKMLFLLYNKRCDCEVSSTMIDILETILSDLSILEELGDMPSEDRLLHTEMVKDFSFVEKGYLKKIEFALKGSDFELTFTPGSRYYIQNTSRAVENEDSINNINIDIMLGEDNETVVSIMERSIEFNNYAKNTLSDEVEDFMDNSSDGLVRTQIVTYEEDGNVKRFLITYDGEFARCIATDDNGAEYYVLDKNLYPVSFLRGKKTEDGVIELFEGYHNRKLLSEKKVILRVSDKGVEEELQDIAENNNMKMNIDLESFWEKFEGIINDDEEYEKIRARYSDATSAVLYKDSLGEVVTELITESGNILKFKRAVTTDAIADFLTLLSNTFTSPEDISDSIAEMERYHCRSYLIYEKGDNCSRNLIISGLMTEEEDNEEGLVSEVIYIDITENENTLLIQGNTKVRSAYDDNSTSFLIKSEEGKNIYYGTHYRGIWKHVLRFNDGNKKYLLTSLEEEYFGLISNDFVYYITYKDDYEDGYDNEGDRKLYSYIICTNEEGEEEEVPVEFNGEETRAILQITNASLRSGKLDNPELVEELISILPDGIDTVRRLAEEVVESRGAKTAAYGEME